MIPEPVLRDDIKIEMDEIKKRLSDKQRKLSAKPAEVVANVWRRQAKTRHASGPRGARTQGRQLSIAWIEWQRSLRDQTCRSGGECMAATGSPSPFRNGVQWRHDPGAPVFVHIHHSEGLGIHLAVDGRSPINPRETIPDVEQVVNQHCIAP